MNQQKLKFDPFLYETLHSNIVEVKYSCESCEAAILLQAAEFSRFDEKKYQRSHKNSLISVN